MPQMMPINWLISIFFFIIVFLMFNIMNYYIFINKNKITNKNFKKYNLNWKW
uniref:ATP synthase F0 subunit 8 n=1 Tax=Parapoynx fluctuosalis TaxID=1557973 RepID=UPI002A82EE20|nr:ATP synthase F0 subunit 8 [Parapoynx fluctuosalis]WNN67136.1 ATP synthase F0 subunit 8 [Parapoynx fluctuosalis]